MSSCGGGGAETGGRAEGIGGGTTKGERVMPFQALTPAAAPAPPAAFPPPCVAAASKVTTAAGTCCCSPPLFLLHGTAENVRFGKEGTKEEVTDAALARVPCTRPRVEAMGQVAANSKRENVQKLPLLLLLLKLQPPPLPVLLCLRPMRSVFLCRG